MRNEPTYKNTGSAWVFLFKIALCVLLFCAFPLVAFHIPVYDKIDIWTNNPLNQSKIALGLVLIFIPTGVYVLAKKLSA
jgi:hypothetical protein